LDPAQTTIKAIGPARAALESHWDALDVRLLTKRVNYSEAYSTAEACICAV
jgi:hypothetical protein